MGARFCTDCGKELVMRESRSGHALRQTCPSCLTTFYDTPYIVAATLPTLDGRVILVRRATDPGIGLWSYAGGYLEGSETLEDAALRETQEETGLEVNLIGLLGVYSRPRGRTVTIVFEAAAKGENWQCGPEVSEIRSFSAEEIPWRELAFGTAVCRGGCEGLTTGQGAGART